MLSELFISLTLKKLKKPLIPQISTPGTDSGISFRHHEIIQHCLCGAVSLPWCSVATTLGCGSFNKSNGTQKNEHKEEIISESWRLVCYCAAFQKKRILSFDLFSKSVFYILLADQTRKPSTEAISICTFWAREINCLLPLHGGLPSLLYSKISLITGFELCVVEEGTKSVSLFI